MESLNTNVNFVDLKQLLSSFNDLREDLSLYSPTYIAITGRKGCFIYKGFGSHIIVCNHPNSDNHILVFPELGDANGFLLQRVLLDLRKHEKVIQLARFPKSEIQKTKKQFEDLDNSFIQNVDLKKETILDWFYPVHIISTQDVSEMKGTKFRKLRYQCQKIRQAYEVNDLSIHDIEANKLMRYILKRWEATMILAEKDTMDITSIYETIFQWLKKYPENFDGRIHMLNGRPFSFIIWDKTMKKEAFVIANLCCGDIKGLSAFQVQRACEILYNQQIFHCNLGGSETQSLDNFKSKTFRPVKSLQLYSADVIFENIEQQAIIYN